MTLSAEDLFEPPLHPWWHAAVVYQVYPRSFVDSDGDGVGDLRGVIQRLDYLRALGIDVIWLSPFFRSPQVDLGYDVSDYCDVDPAFGTLEDLDELIREAHARKLKIMLDLVFNHTSDQHPWFQASLDPTSDKRDWYYWRPAREGFVAGMAGAEPTNWASVWGGSAWQYDATSGEYYLHLFSKEQPDLNWHCPAVRRELARIARWWVARGVDGFRFDVINYIGKPEDLHDLPAEGGSLLAYDLGAMLDAEVTHEFLAELRREGFPDDDILTVGEMPGCSVALAQSYTDPERHELSMVFTFEHADLDHVPGASKWAARPLPLPELKRCIENWQLGLSQIGWNSLYWCNHDQPRVVSRWGDDSPEHRIASAKAWATVLHLLRGTPYVYQGEELGMTNAGFTAIEQYRDIESLRFHAEALEQGTSEDEILAALARSSRDNARTPMQWNDGEGAGFTTGTPWLPVNVNHADVNAAQAYGDAGSIWHHYRALIALRHELTLVSDGEFELWLPDHPQVFAYRRCYAGQIMLVVANLSGEAVQIPNPEDEGDIVPLHTALLVLSSHEPASTDPWAFQPWESRVYLWS